MNGESDQESFRDESTRVSDSNSKQLFSKIVNFPWSLVVVGVAAGFVTTRLLWPVVRFGLFRVGRSKLRKGAVHRLVQLALKGLAVALPSILSKIEGKMQTQGAANNFTNQQIPDNLKKK
jgi:hypothetical protein